MKNNGSIVWAFHKQSNRERSGEPVEVCRILCYNDGKPNCQEAYTVSTSSEIRELALKTGFFEAGCVNIKTLQYYPEVRAICEKNTCRNYGTSWACPPAVGTAEECRERVEQYQKMLLFSKKYELEDSFDLEGMLAGMQDFKHTVDAFHKAVEPVLPRFLLLSNEGCGRCKTCTYPDAPCRFPKMLHHSLEGYGFIVSELAAEAGVHYINGTNTVTFFGAILFDEK